MKIIRGFVETLQRSVAGAGELLHAIVGLLGQSQLRVRALLRRLALRDVFRPRAYLDMREVGGRDGERRLRLVKLGN